MNSRTHTNISTPEQISTMLHNIRKLRVEHGQEVRFFMSSVGTVKLRIYKDGKNQWLHYEDAVKYVPKLQSV